MEWIVAILIVVGCVLFMISNLADSPALYIAGAALCLIGSCVGGFVVHSYYLTNNPNWLSLMISLIVVGLLSLFLLIRGIIIACE